MLYQVITNLFNDKNYENSRNEYRSALEIKPEESYPQERNNFV